MMDVRAYAKINLGLQIVRKREDGYHDIDTVFHRINLYDTLSFTPSAAGITFECSDPTLPSDDSNLCVKAARMLFESCGYNGGVRISLTKEIPTGAGLGGGSSDAAAVLRHLPRLLSIPVTEEDLFQLALRLGSDVPYFLHDGSAYAKGRGELLAYFDLPMPFWILTVYPGVHVSTPWAYGNFRIQPEVPILNLKELILSHMSDPAALRNTLRNDFEPLVLESYQDIRITKDTLYLTGADFALMSGSGSSVFGLYKNGDFAHEAHAFFRKTHRAFLSEPYFNSTCCDVC